MCAKRKSRSYGISNREFWESGVKNARKWQRFYDYLTELAISRFTWTGLPDTIDERYLELSLYYEGKVVFFKDDVGFLALRCAMMGNMNVYSVPTERMPVAPNIAFPILNEENSVMIYNNMLRKPTSPVIMTYCDDLYDIENSIIVNAKAQKTPILILCPENKRLTMKNLYMKYEGNEPFIFGDNTLNPQDFRVLSTGAPFVASSLYSLKQNIWDEAITYLGISSSHTQKKERLIRSEVAQSEGVTLSSRESSLKARQTACEQINAMWGLDVWCEFNEKVALAETKGYEDRNTRISTETTLDDEGE